MKLLCFLQSLLLFGLIYLHPAPCLSQEETGCPGPEDKKVNNMLEKAKSLYKDKSYGDAYLSLRKICDEDPEISEVYFLMGMINIKRSVPNISAAKKNFQKALELCPEINPYAHFYLGDIAFGEQQYEAAVTHLRVFMRDVDKIQTDKDYDRAEVLLRYAAFYSEMISKPVPFSPRPVPGLCSTMDEYLPIISPDNEMALFTRMMKMPPDRSDLLQKEKMKERFLFARRVNDNFENVDEMPWPFNQQDNEGGATLTIDNKKLIYTLCKYVKGGSYYNCDICYTKYRFGSWDEIENLGGNINLPDAWESQPSISSDGKTLYFVSDRKGGFGGYDIYMSTLDEKGEWKPAVNMGPGINTAGNEKAPFIHPDNHTFYFSSTGIQGMGGYDIFFCKRGDDGTWGKPRNIGYPINTQDDEVGFFVSTDGHYGYFASNKYKGPGGYDIFYFDLYEEARPEKVLFVKGELKDEQTREPVRARVELKNATTKKVTSIPVDTLTGEYAAVVLFRNDYILTVKGEGYGYESRYISKEDSAFQAPVKVDIEVKPVEIGKAYKLNDIYFETDKFELVPSSKLVIDEFYQYLQENPRLKISIQGYTDDVGNDEYNQKLSENRAKSVYDYLIEKSVDPSRLTYKGFGERNPVAPNTTAEGRALNRRTVFVIIEK